MPLGDFQNSVKKSQRSTKLRTAALNRVRRVISLASCQPLFQASTAQYQARTAQLLTFPSEETQRSGVCIQHSSSLEGFPEDCFLSCLIWCTEGTGIAWSLNAAKPKEKWGVAACSQCCREGEEGDFLLLCYLFTGQLKGMVSVSFPCREPAYSGCLGATGSKRVKAPCGCRTYSTRNWH